MPERLSCSAHQDTLEAADEEKGSLVGTEGGIPQEDKFHSPEGGKEDRISRGTAE